MPKSPQNGGSNQFFRHSGRTFRTRAWRVAPCRRPAAPFRKFHTKCVASHLILRMKNSESEQLLAVGCTRFCVRHFPRVHQRAPRKVRLPSTPRFCAPPPIYHPCQCRASAAAPGDPMADRAQDAHALFGMVPAAIRQ